MMKKYDKTYNRISKIGLYTFYFTGLIVSMLLWGWVGFAFVASVFITIVSQMEIFMADKKKIDDDNTQKIVQVFIDEFNRNQKTTSEQW